MTIYLNIDEQAIRNKIIYLNNLVPIPMYFTDGALKHLQGGAGYIAFQHHKHIELLK